MFTSRTRDANISRRAVGQPLELPRLLSEALHDPYAGDVFFDDVGDVACPLLRVPARGEHRRAQLHRGERAAAARPRASPTTAAPTATNMTANDTTNSRMFAMPIGRNCKKPWMSATSDDARLTSWPVCSSSWRAKSSRWSCRKIAVRRSCCTSSAMRPPRKRRKYANTNVSDTHHDHERQPRRERAGCAARDHVVDHDLLHRPAAATG